MGCSENDFDRTMILLLISDSHDKFNLALTPTSLIEADRTLPQLLVWLHLLIFFFFLHRNFFAIYQLPICFSLDLYHVLTRFNFTLALFEKSLFLLFEQLLK